jgi:(S)-2-hydroxyglutarate dehydrogenase
LKKRYPTFTVRLIEKELSCGMPAIGWNSGVPYAGFYGLPGSLKARFTRDGNDQLKAYREEKRIPLKHCRKMVVTGDTYRVASPGETHEERAN